MFVLVLFKEALNLQTKGNLKLSFETESLHMSTNKLAFQVENQLWRMSCLTFSYTASTCPFEAPGNGM